MFLGDDFYKCDVTLSVNLRKQNLKIPIILIRLKIKHGILTRRVKMPCF